MNSGDVHRHQAHPPLAQHVVHGGHAPPAGCGWYTPSATPPAPHAAAPTAPQRLKRLQPPPQQLPSGGSGIVSGAGAPLSPSALHSLPVLHNSVAGMSSSVRVPPPAGAAPAPAMHASQTAPSCPWPAAGGAAKGASDLLVNTSYVSPPPTWLANMASMPFKMLTELSEFHYKPGRVKFYIPPKFIPGWHHGAISRERAEQLLSNSLDGVFLVRESTNFPGDHTLCVRFKGRVEHYRVKWAPGTGGHSQRLTIDDEEFFDNMTDLIDHYLQDADGLCTRLVRCLPKQMSNGPTVSAANNNVASQPAYSASQPAGFQSQGFIPPQPPTQPPSQPAPFPPSQPPTAGAQNAAFTQQAFQHNNYVNTKQPGDQTDSATPCLVPQAFVDAGWMIQERDLEIRENIGKGEFGDVMLGILNGTQKVAVKILKDREAASKFLAEASLMTSLKDDNLVRLLGLVFSSNGSTCIVTEHMAQGSLLDYLRSRGRHYVTQKHQINFAYDACCGMEYLERRRVVHRDLAARNVLIARDGTAKVADFGLARPDAPRPDDPHAQAKLPIKWTAPEALKYNKFSNKSDMWSFGILLWEIYSFGRVPYPRIPLAEVVRHVERGYRMEAPEGCPAEPYEVMRAAWHAEPAHRPTFHSTRQRLATLRDATPNVNHEPNK